MRFSSRLGLGIGLLVLIAGLNGCSGAADTADPPEPEIPEPRVVATVIELSGELVQAGKTLQAGDEVAMDAPFDLKSGKAVVEIPDVGRVRIFPKTRLQLRNQNTLRLWLGKIWAIITPSAKQFEVETDNAVAGVRGTEFLVERTPTSTRVSVTKGKVAVKNRAKASPEVVVQAGEQVDVVGAEGPAAKVEFEAELEEENWRAPADGAAAPVPEPMKAPKPGVEVDREAMKKHEHKGEEQKKELQEQMKQQREQLHKQEQKTREKLEDKQKAEEDLEESMGMDKKLAPKKGSLKEKSIRKKKDTEMEDFLK